MAEVKKLIQLTVDSSKPVEEIKACLIAISLEHGANQLSILQEVDIWLGNVIAEAEKKNAELQNHTEQ